MEIVVNVKEARHLSQSELILRNLFATVQVGSSTLSGNGVRVCDAKFRSGTSENPLVMSVRNSQTETVMYVRNVPISTVLQSARPFEHWIAVYPPGDPQNLHFDSSQPPKDGCPQLLVSIEIDEGNGAPRSSVGPRPSFDYNPTGADPLRRSVDSLQAEMQRSRPSAGVGERSSWSPQASPSYGSQLARASEGLSSSYGGSLDNTVREKEIEARRIKESVAAMALANQRAGDVTKQLQDNRRILDNLTEQLRGLESQLSEQRAATQIVMKDRDRLLAEEEELLEQVRQRDQAFQALRDNRDEIDREISRALGEREHQRMAMDNSTANFQTQTQTLVGDIDQSKRQVQELSEALREREARAREAEDGAKAAAEARRASAEEERRKMREELDKTREVLHASNLELGEDQRRRATVQLAQREVDGLLAGLEREAELVSREDDSQVVGDSAAELASKRERLKEHVDKVVALEEKLQENRQQIWNMSTMHSELHTQAKEKELAALRGEAASADLKQELETRRALAAAAKSSRDSAEQQLDTVQRELERVRSSVEASEAALAERRERQAAEEASLQTETQQREAELAAALAQISELQASYGDLDATVGTQRQRRAALEAFQSRADALSQELRQASDEAGRKSAALEALRVEADAKSRELETLQIRGREHQQRSSALRENRRQSLDESVRLAADLDATIVCALQDLDTHTGASAAAAKAHALTRDELEEAERSLAELVARVESLAAKDAQENAAADELAGKHASATSELAQRGEAAEEAESRAQANAAALAAARAEVDKERQRVAEFQAELEREPLRLEEEARALEEEHERERGKHGELQGRLGVLRVESEAYKQDLAAHEREQALLEAELEGASAERERQATDVERAVEHQELLASEAEERAERASARASELELRLEAAAADHSEVGAAVAAARLHVLALEGEAREAAAACAGRSASAAATRRELDRQRALTERAETASKEIGSEASELRLRLETAEVQAASRESLARRHALLLEEHSRDEDLHRQVLADEAAQAEAFREELAHRRRELLRTKGAEIGQQVEQVDLMEMDRLQLTQQAARDDVELQQLRESLGEQEGAEQELVLRAQRAEEDDRSAAAELSRLRDSDVPALEARSAALARSTAESAACLAALRREAADSKATVDELTSQVALARARSGREAAAAGAGLERASVARAAQDRCREELEAELQRLANDEADSQRRNADTVREVERLSEAVAKTRAELEKQVAQSDAARKGSKGSAASSGAAPDELEGALQRVTDNLADALERARRSKAREDALQQEVEKLKENVRAGLEKMNIQVEHDDLQFETIHTLGEQKRRFEGEVEVLTLGLHDAEQRNAFLMKENLLMQQQVEGIYHGSLQDWAQELQEVKVAGEVARYKEEITLWKQKAEDAKKQKAMELTRNQAQHEETVQGLRDRVGALRREKQRLEHLLGRHEALLRRASGQSGSQALTGLSVPQRPLQVTHRRRKALLVGSNYGDSHAPLKGCINDVFGLQCLLRHTLQFSDDQLCVLVDGGGEGSRTATKANIIAGLQWLVAGAQAGDTLLFAFCGYGAQHPRSPAEPDQYEAYLVPCDFAADLPADATGSLSASSSQPPTPNGVSSSAAPARSWLGGLGRVFRSASSSTAGAGAAAGGGGAQARGTASYRLIPLLEVHDYINRLPAYCRMTVLLDCCYSVMPGVRAQSSFPATFPKVDRGRVDYAKLRDFISRPRFLELPVLPVCHTPEHLLRASPTFPRCTLQCFSACKQREWCAEFPIEGTVQGAFTWSFLKALARGHFHCGIYQLLRTQALILADLSQHFKGVEQTPVLQQSQTAGMHDVVLWT
eukprot:TRINITY_DN10705_c1_g1_i2.p1 TRINITY_DN10705_c1_g1~~TRINITY_DN10705_c1_g1_i2.p1  ORF type:complete len:1840 (-),score=512.63 TRINITY_DN10705_c1_g1_i2:85-5604(-)